MSIQSNSDQTQAVSLTYCLYDRKPVRIAEGAVEQPQTQLAAAGSAELPLALDAAKAPGMYTAKLIAVTAAGARAVKLVDYEVK